VNACGKSFCGRISPRCVVSAAETWRLICFRKCQPTEQNQNHHAKANTNILQDNVWRFGSVFVRLGLGFCHRRTLTQCLCSPRSLLLTSCLAVISEGRNTTNFIDPTRDPESSSAKGSNKEAKPKRALAKEVSPATGCPFASFLHEHALVVGFVCWYCPCAIYFVIGINARLLASISSMQPSQCPPDGSFSAFQFKLECCVTFRGNMLCLRLCHMGSHRLPKNTRHLVVAIGGCVD